ncbi:hypothetical protein VTK26DRAFT_7812 [Humicola hyalothermophila]
MSATPSRHGRTSPTTPLHERSNSQNNGRLGIRIVPYSPPRPNDDERAPSQASSRENAGSRCSGNHNDQPSSSASQARRPSRQEEVTKIHASRSGSALSSSAAPAFSLASSRDERVSGVTPVASPSGEGPAGLTEPPPRRRPSEVSTDRSIPHASEVQRGRTNESSSSPTPANSKRPRALSRRRNLQLAVHPDGTFSLVRDDQDSDVPGSRTGSLTSPPLSHASRTPSAQDRPSVDTWSDRRASTLTGASTTILDNSLSELPRSATSSAASSSTQLVEDPTSASPWNYRMVGGLRKVPTTPDAKGKQPLYNTSTPTSETSLPPLPEAVGPKEEEEQVQAPSSRAVVLKASFASVASDQTVSTFPEAANYIVYEPDNSAQQSSDSLVFSSASPPNWQVLGQSSPAPAISSSPPTVAQSSENYVLHGAPSESSSSSLATVVRRPRPAYSQESLVVPPLRPHKRRSSENFGYYKQRSRESLRSRTNSVQSLKTLSSIISTPDPSLLALAAPVLLNLGTAAAWSGSQRPRSSSLSSKSNVSHRPPSQMLQSHPHQWSSQLSTVMSESEGGSAPARSVSPLSDMSGHHRRRRSTGWVSSMHSRQMASISSSLAGQLEEAAAAADSLERSEQGFSRPGPSQIRLVRDQDEYGDGLADLDHKPSTSGLSAMFANGLSRHYHSNSSSRANSLTSSFPAWAQVYYGSGERRFLGRRPSFMTISESADSRPGSASFMTNESPNTDQFPQAIYSPRKRPREVQPTMAQQQLSPNQAAMEIAQAPPAQEHGIFRTLKEKTSSIWSPHLQPDRRASRYSVWEPPSVSWSADTGVLGRRNSQVLLFIIGFIFPLAWMIAAFLPLPPNPKTRMYETDNNKSQFGGGHPASRYRQYLIEESRYESARWWRNLNRLMSVLGLLIIGAVIALAVVGVRQGWGSRN